MVPEMSLFNNGILSLSSKVQTHNSSSTSCWMVPYARRLLVALANFDAEGALSECDLNSRRLLEALADIDAEEAVSERDTKSRRLLEALADIDAEEAVSERDTKSRRLLEALADIDAEEAVSECDPSSRSRRLVAAPIVALAKKRTVSKSNFIVVSLTAKNWIK